MATVKLDWSDTNTQETGHEIYRSTSSINTSSPGTPLASLGANVITYNDTTAVEGTTYFYRVAATRLSEKAFSGEVEITIPTPLNAPTDLTGTIL
ncbi:hypothetical protein [Nodularia sphaerocarpa]|uniref:hypothetical protein n=1 Tax=Nodularia sphaerocarpa TaxID=137816 RepID=UPI001EFB03E1|nr:hypothetical protein [Nodularia sphaerocarpa]MDB9372395.1 hypothetical protein [Nodularia sphaerocarpa CS-585]ULP71466.1 hypothetical protein BDGGKGIB_01092 [Nodularia sphaerocarpa UHCC 0038]ULP73406.1 hypothetical protein BDGGKGIB_03059 [Nodularia sphaerocarpa UHCC 0038]